MCADRDASQSFREKIGVLYFRPGRDVRSRYTQLNTSPDVTARVDEYGSRAFTFSFRVSLFAERRRVCGDPDRRAAHVIAARLSGARRFKV